MKRLPSGWWLLPALTTSVATLALLILQSL